MEGRRGGKEGRRKGGTEEGREGRREGGERNEGGTEGRRDRGLWESHPFISIATGKM